MNGNMIPEEWKKNLECHNVHFTFCEIGMSIKPGLIPS